MIGTEVRRSKRWLPWLLAGGLVVAAGTTVGVAAVVDDDESDVPTMGMTQVAAMGDTCTQWQDEARVGMPQSWCDDLTSFMTGQMRNGNMTPTMMMGTPERMRATCRRFAATEPGSAAGAACDELVSWMEDRDGRLR